MFLKRLLKGFMYGFGLTPAEVLYKYERKKSFSFSGEEKVIQEYLTALQVEGETPFVVDIAAADGVTLSNTFTLFVKGAAGLAVEYDFARFRNLTFAYSRFPNVALFRGKALPGNVVSILKAALVPREFSFLSLDIDSYDYFVLDQLLRDFRPTLICAEINEIIPPPLKFTVLYDPEHGWAGDNFQGQSICKLFELCEKYQYDLVSLLYNNAFLIPREKNKFPALDPAAAYREGYRFRPGRTELFSARNQAYEGLFEMSPEDARIFLNELFKKYRGKYELA